VCGRTACTVRGGGGRKPEPVGYGRAELGASRRPYKGRRGPACCLARGVDAYALRCLVLPAAEPDRLREAEEANPVLPARPVVLDRGDCGEANWEPHPMSYLNRLPSPGGMGGRTFSEEMLSVRSSRLRCTSRKYPRSLRISLAIEFISGIGCNMVAEPLPFTSFHWPLTSCTNAT
jgi:hypothetical protein